MYDVMAHLGHKSIKTTIDTYGHPFPQALDRIRDRQEAIWKRAKAKAPRAPAEADPAPSPGQGLIGGREKSGETSTAPTEEQGQIAPDLHLLVGLGRFELPTS